MARVWNEQDDEVLRDMSLDFTAGEVGEVLGRTRASVGARARRLGIQLRVDNRKAKREVIDGVWHRECKHCESMKPEETDFYWNANKHRYEAGCRPCRNEIRAMQELARAKETIELNMPATRPAPLSYWNQPNGYTHSGLGQEVLAVSAQRQDAA